MKKLIIFLVLCSSIKAEWFFENDKTSLTNLYSLAAMDMLYTSRNLQTGEIYEINPLLGRHPTDTRLLVTALSANLLFSEIYYSLPKSIKKIVILSVIIIESGFSITTGIWAHKVHNKVPGIAEYRDPYFSFVVYQW